MDKACHPQFSLLRRNGIFLPPKVLRRSLDGCRKYRSLYDFLNSKKNVKLKTKVSGSYIWATLKLPIIIDDKGDRVIF